MLDAEGGGDQILISDLRRLYFDFRCQLLSMSVLNKLALRLAFA